jgi:hypothetical protein
MKVLKPDAIPAEPANSPLFTGGPVTRQTLLTPEMSNNFNLAVVNFSAGARNKMHTHSSDQVLFVTAGKGIIATGNAPGGHQRRRCRAHSAGRETLARGHVGFLILPHCVNSEREHDHAGGKVS